MSSKKKSRSLLGRLFGRGQRDRAGSSRPARGKGRGDGRKQDAAGGKAATDRRPLTPRERSLAEVRQMARIGQRDPERLAVLLSGLLAKDRARRRADQELFEQQVQDILHRDSSGDAEEAAPGDGETPAPG